LDLFTRLYWDELSTEHKRGNVHGSWIIPQLSPVGPSAVKCTAVFRQCSLQSKSENKFSWWASMLDLSVDGCTINC